MLKRLLDVPTVQLTHPLQDLDASAQAPDIEILTPCLEH
jgi:hypothetical protein